MKPPRRRPDNLCANADCRKPIPQTINRFTLNPDEPWCSSKCARAYYGTSLQEKARSTS